MTVPAVVSLITLGVRDVERSTAFYQALGWPLSSASVPGEVSFFRTAGAILTVWSADELAGDAGAAPRSGDGFRGVGVAINCESREQVDEVLAAAEAAGATITKPAHAADWGGYTSYFADPDGHAWEVAHNPHWPIGEDGLPNLPA
jgi:catechol 2,3-dioxygenase-like lactoylglutathione lyase family enzyme